MAATILSAAAATRVAGSVLGPLGLADMRITSTTERHGAKTVITGRTWHTPEAFQAAARRLAEHPDVATVLTYPDKIIVRWS